MTVRLKDIAARAGVSLMTVSKAMREASDVSAQTRARIRLLAQQMGYVPNSMAQGLRNRSNRLLGLVLSSVSDPIFTGAVAAIEEGAHEWGCDLMLGHTLNSPEREEACIRRLLARRVDGLLIFPTYRLAPTAAIYDVLLQRQTPTVILGQRAPFCAQFQNVESDDRGGSYQMTRHLLELGHKRIAFLCGPPGSPWAQERLEGYRRALREEQIEPDDRLIFTAGATIEDGGKAALQMLNESVSVTAIQAANDSVAIGAANVFLNQGIKIPGALSIGGFGNILLSEHFRVPLTTVRQPKFRLGLSGMELMQKLLRGEGAESKRLAARLDCPLQHEPSRVLKAGMTEDDNSAPVDLPIDGVLDLHTFKPREIGSLVPAYLDECRQHGILQVRIIHGKGIGQLQRSVHAILSKRTDVVRYSFASANFGGRGATIVTLRA